MPKRLLILLFMMPFFVQAQGSRVPSRMEFAGIKLRIAEGARKEIQDDVDALTKSPKYFNIKVERARSYFPIIERVFKEEGLHDDFKYLVLQESALIPDAVSTSNAVGFWQFKDFTAQEVGMRVDGHIDERMNIVSASRGAAKYMKKNNQFFDNWLHALQAYQMGAGGAMRVLGKGDEGANSMVINKKTYWYVKKYLAHKIAFQDAVGEAGLVQLREYNNGAGKTLKDISRETGVSLAQLQDYNKWLRKGKIPEDRTYTVIVPITELQNVNLAAFKDSNNNNNNTQPEVSRTVEYDFDNPDKFPVYEDYVMASRGSIVDINGIPATMAKAGDKIPELAERGEVDLKKFLKYNDIDISSGLIPGQVYYFKKKKNKAKTHYYVIQPGENLWSVSQKFGIKLKKLKSKNRIRKNDGEVKAGRVLWLRFIRPARIEPEYREVKQPDEKPQVISSKSIVKKEEAPQEQEIAMEEVAEPVIKESDASVVKNETPSVNKVKPSVRQEYADPIEEGEVDEEEVMEENEQQPFEGRSQVHVVKPGETLYSISRMYNITIKDLLAWNDMDISQKLSINQKLVIYNKSMIEGEKRMAEDEKSAPVERSEVEEIYHTVVQGDTMYNIAKKYEVTIEEIMKWNDKTDFSIGLGEKIKIVKRPNK
ncbi:lytic transglycosylase domain-containing protein [Fulvivirga sediminis]|uniref:LysM peptidoglycan-binding domain-containing protein n=1 Tax=Fulvivirga sediminis TaxID=2803949 RepID=A0A937F8R5_9BACT|nr:lytic transglycosylase domain-containing protein [Fulvivirga sediminis]MBL3656684.1 LysM peptidoglycan-binding domain-containing protein [Fulvivirga sediminis]